MPPKKRAKSSCILSLKGKSYRLPSASNAPSKEKTTVKAQKKKKLDTRYVELQERSLTGKCAKKAVKGFVLAAPILPRAHLFSTYNAALASDELFTALEHSEPASSSSPGSVNTKLQSKERSNPYELLAECDEPKKSLFSPAPSILGSSAPSAPYGGQQIDSIDDDL